MASCQHRPDLALTRHGEECGAPHLVPPRAGKVWAGQVADFQALMGKREVGIQGVGGLSARAAANLLRK